MNEINLIDQDNYNKIKENHFIIYDIFDSFNNMLNENNIEYYYTSGILPYILTGKPLERYHHDLDIFINMDFLSTLEKIAKAYNFTFKRKLGERPDGTQRRVLKMYYMNYDIPITIFMYSRKKDGSIIQHDYFFDENNELYVEEIHNTKRCGELSFSDEPHYHNGILYKSISLEALYLSKIEGNRAKDKYDCTIMKPYIDIKTLKELKEELKNNLPNKVYLVHDEEIKRFILEEKKATVKKIR